MLWRLGWHDAVLAVDTNVLVRFLIDETPKQVAAVKGLFSTDDIWIAKTVLLESAWVLENLFGLTESDIRDGFMQLLRLENVDVEDESSVLAALGLMEHGIELADAFHLASTPKGCGFVSFDRTLVRRAHRAGIAEVSDLSTKT